MSSFSARKNRNRIRGNKPGKEYSGPQPTPALRDGGRTTRCKFVEKTIMVQGQPRKNRRIETLRTNLFKGYTDFLLSKNPEAAGPQLVQLYAQAQQAVKHLNYSQLKQFSYA